MADIWEKVISILAGNLNSDLSYLITTVKAKVSTQFSKELRRNSDVPVNDLTWQDLLLWTNSSLPNKRVAGNNRLLLPLINREGNNKAKTHRMRR